MFDEFLDLPAHPLFVHVPIVLIPLLIMMSIVYSVMPRVRPYTEWAAAGLAIVTPAVTWVTRESGYALEDRLAENFGGAVPEELAADIDEHARLSYTLIWLVAALSLVTLVVIVAARRTRSRHEISSEDESLARASGSSARVVTLVGAVLVVGLALASGWYVFQTGDLGARMVWEGQ